MSTQTDWELFQQALSDTTRDAEADWNKFAEALETREEKPNDES